MLRNLGGLEVQEARTGDTAHLTTAENEVDS